MTLCSVVVVLTTAACTIPDRPSTSPSTPPSRSPATALRATPLPISGASDCEELSSRTVDALQAYVDEIADLRPAQLGEAVAEQQGTLDEIAASMRERARALGCDRLGEQLTIELDRLEGTTPLARSVAGTIRGSLLGTDDPSDPGPTDVTVDDADELRAAVAQAGTGSVITISAGTYELDRALVFFRPVTVRGPADAAAVITSTAEGAALFSVADGELSLHQLTVRHIGSSAASVVVVRAGGHDLRDVEIQGGRRSDDGVGGFGLAVHPVDDRQDVAAVVQDSTFRDNQAGAMLLGADVTATIRGVTIEGPGGCGICFHERAAGVVESSDIQGHELGIRIEDRASPVIRENEIHDNTVGIGAIGADSFTLTGNTIADNATGLEVAGSGTPSMDGDRLADNADVGLRLAGQTEAVVRDVSVEGTTEIALILAGDADPSVEGGMLATTGEAGIVVTGSARGTIAGVGVTGQRIGFQIEQQAGTGIAGASVERVGEIAVILTGQSTPGLRDVTCPDDDTGIIALLEGTDPDLGEGIGCEVVDQRG